MRSEERTATPPSPPAESSPIHNSVALRWWATTSQRRPLTTSSRARLPRRTGSHGAGIRRTDPVGDRVCSDTIRDGVVGAWIGPCCRSHPCSLGARACGRPLRLCEYLLRPFPRSQGHSSSVQTISKSYSRCVLTTTRYFHSHTCIIPKAHDAVMLHGSQHRSREDGSALQDLGRAYGLSW